ncbi:cytochrome b5 [Colletotrichum scovillei]|uniref:Cytochrome b5 n=1 Tax=Colletotrichum scovillei TaxID=1209932 RepID=A0A9P7QXS9_9PEZI|nr:cytochrome b5 [Colletotrichum scovillei]KAG7046244.1 cytochrome b5 [Colletotrichum scovillei]KAG7063594.1 cytochrome b5 [Colletotrichum scovillei]
MQVLGRSDLSKHHDVDSLWVSIRGKGKQDIGHPLRLRLVLDYSVYDVTNYADDHPGGIEVLKDVAGDASYGEIDILHGGPGLSAWTWFYLGMALSTVIWVSGCLYIYTRFTETLEYYKEVWEYPSYYGCKVNRAGI